MTSRKKSRTWISPEEGPKEAAEELLVFGYSCKVFRDEEKATYIEEGKHLIPWMDNKGLLIDRYDGRGHLHNLQEYEPMDEKDAAENFSEEDLYLEQLLDEERYMALQKNLTEEELYHEEEIKRLRAALIDDGAYNQVGFSYEEQQQMALNGQKAAEQQEANGEDQTDDEIEAFVPQPELNVPEGMEVPPSAKVNAIIEKTAMFVSRQGPQMEIVIKAKQANNAQFSFLAFDHSLNPYYKHMVQAMKTGKYVPRPQNNASDDEDGDSDGDHYLHPSLLASQPPQVLHVPKLTYASTGKDPYSLLVSQLKDKVYLGLQDTMQEGVRAGNCTPPPSQPRPLTTVEPSPPPPPPGIAPVTLPQGTMEIPDASFPPADMLPIVDRMASYVAKNGVDFEAIVKRRGADDRFEFLKPGHRFYKYYQYKLKMYEKQLQIEKENLLKEAAIAEDKEAKLADKVVSFSIKMKETSEKRNALVLVENEEGNNGVSEDGESATTNEEKAVFEKEQAASVDVAASVVVATAANDPANRVRVQSQEAKLAEERIRDRLAAAARERLVQVSREKQLQMERKRKAALFLTMLNKGKEDDANMIGPRLPNAAELEILVDTEADLPLIPSFLNGPLVAPASLFQPQAMLQPFAALAPMTLDPVTAAIQDKTVDALIRSHVSNSMKMSSPQPLHKPPPTASHHHHRHHKGRGRDRRGSTRSRSRSRDRKSRKKSRSRSRTRSRSRERKNRKRSRRSSRSRSKERRRRHRSSRHSSREKDEKATAAATDKRKSSRTPPAAYSSPRKSDSPRRGKSDRGNKSRSSTQRDRRSRSTSRRRSRDDKGGKDSSSSPPPHSDKKKDSGRGSSSSKQHSTRTSKGKSRSRSRSRRRSRSPRKSRSPSRSKDSKR